MKYFLIPWKNISLAKKELEILWYKYLFKDWIFFVDKFLKDLSMFVKWGEVVESLWYVKLLWTNDEKFASLLKESWLIKRYKIYDIKHTDIEVKKNWIEVYRVWENLLKTNWRQNIDLYEQIDYWKPIRSMKIWMMPSKLAHFLVNISFSDNIYDPFCWLWTILMIWNYLWKKVYWSDINPTPSKINLNWRKKNKYYKDNEIKIFKHDMLKPINIKVWDVVTEWYLWPIVKKVEFSLIKDIEKKLYYFYKKVLENLFSINAKNYIYCIPFYSNENNQKIYLDKIIKLCKGDYIWDYIRKNQKVWRMIFIKKSS